MSAHFLYYNSNGLEQKEARWYGVVVGYTKSVETSHQHYLLYLFQFQTTWEIREQVWAE